MEPEQEEIAFDIKCSCGYNRDHLTRLVLSEDFEDVIIGSGMCHYLPWYKRLFIGVKYIFGIDNTFSQYVESVVSKEEMVRLSEWIDNVIVRMK